MWPNSQFPVDLVTFTEGLLNGKLNLLCNDVNLGNPLRNHWKKKWNI